MLFKVTVGIRTYNVQHYIILCLNSVYNQSIKTDLKIVLVDDCSTDKTLVVVNDWVALHKDFNIDVYTNANNKGAGVMFMLLLDYIKDSEYVIFLDGDDFYTKSDCLEYMYNFIKKHNFDFVRFTNKPEDHHTKTLVCYDLFKLIKFNPFRVLEDHYYWLLLRMTDNYVLHNYDFYYYRNNSNSLIRCTGKTNYLSDIFDRVYYLGVPEVVKQLPSIDPGEYIDVYNELLSVTYNICPAVLVLSRDTDLNEFIEHYYKLGFLQVFILDNNDIPVQYTNACVIPYNNIPLVTFPEFQSTAYDYALRIIKESKYNYLLVVDDDEYLQLKGHLNIISFIEEELLSKNLYNCDFQWETYDDNDIIYEKDVKGSIQNTYTRKLQRGKRGDFGTYNWTKALYRLSPDINYSRSINPGHNPSEVNYKRYVINSDIAVLKHYRTLCLETFLKSKVLNKNFEKGRFGSTGLLSAYFCINKCSFEKLEAYKQLCGVYNIDYDKSEYEKYLLLCYNNDKLSIIIPINNEEEVSLVELLSFPNDANVLLVTACLLNILTKYPIKYYSINISDAISHTIRTLESEFGCVLFPNSKIYADKFSKQLLYLRDNLNVDVVTCNCLYNGKINVKLIFSTIMFRVNSFKNLDLLVEDYYESYDKFFINIRNLNIKNIDEVLQEESFILTPCSYKIHNLFDQEIFKDITIIITFLNEGVEVKKTVESIRATTVGIPIILIDDFSTDSYDYESLSKIYNCRYIRNSENLGVAGSRDLGVQMCDTEYFVLLDGHMRFYDIDWDNQFVEILSKNPNSIVCSNTTSINNYYDYGYISEQKQYTLLEGCYIDFTSISPYSTKWSFTSLDEGSLTRIPCVMGACYASTKTHWNNIRGLQGLVKYGCDELLMSIKTWLSGGECLLIKDFYVGHLYRNKPNYYVTNDHVLANKIFLANLFEFGLEDLQRSSDTIMYNKCLQKLDFDKLNLIKLDFKKNVQKYSFDYFLNINNLVQQNNRK